MSTIVSRMEDTGGHMIPRGSSWNFLYPQDEGDTDPHNIGDLCTHSQDKEGLPETGRPVLILEIPIDSGMVLSIRIDKLRVFINKTLSIQRCVCFITT